MRGGKKKKKRKKRKRVALQIDAFQVFFSKMNISQSFSSGRSGEKRERGRKKKKSRMFASLILLDKLRPIVLSRCCKVAGEKGGRGKGGGEKGKEKGKFRFRVVLGTSGGKREKGGKKRGETGSPLFCLPSYLEGLQRLIEEKRRRRRGGKDSDSLADASLSLLIIPAYGQG